METAVNAILSSVGRAIVGGDRTWAGLFSTNQGTSWSASNSGLQGAAVISLGVSTDAASWFAGIAGQGICPSVNGGQSWTAINASLPRLLSANSFASRGNRIYVGSVYGVFASEDNG